MLHAHVFQVKEKAKEIQTGIKFAMEAYQQYSVALGDTAAANAAADAADDAARSKSSSDLKAFDAFYLGFQTVDKVTPGPPLSVTPLLPPCYPLPFR